MASELEKALSRARRAHGRGELQRAEDEFRQAIAAGAEGFADVHHALGMIHHTRGALAQATAAFEKALELNPQYAEASISLAITYNDLGRYDEAEALIARSREIPVAGEISDLAKGKIANLHAELAEAYRSVGMHAESAMELRRALTLRPGYVDIRANLARALADAEQVPEAIEELQAVLEQKADYVPAMLHLGLLLISRGRGDEAKEHLEGVLALDASQERAKAYLRMLEPSDSKE